MNQIVLVLQTVLVGDIATPPVVKPPNVPTVFKAGWVPRVMTLACTGIRRTVFAFVTLVTWVVVVSWNAPGEGNALMANACVTRTTSKGGKARIVNSMDVLGSTGTVMVMGFVTRIRENVSVIRCGLVTTVEQRTVWELHLAQVAEVAMHFSFLDGATATGTGPGRRVTYPVFMVLIMAILPVVYVNRVTLELDVTSCVPDTAVVSVVGVSVMFVLDIKENSVKFSDVPAGQKTAVVVVRVT